uniref:Uncharacterized protein n=1 Tax=Pararge aegeria TaxID=116150 RepID=S4NS99_9NEOP
MGTLTVTRWRSIDTIYRTWHSVPITNRHLFINSYFCSKLVIVTYLQGRVEKGKDYEILYARFWMRVINY